MIKAARRLLARLPVVPRTSFTSPVSGISDNALIVRNFTSVSAASATDRNFASSGSGISSSIHANFSIFKGKAALTVEPCMPKFTKKDSGAIFINKSGSVMLTFMPSTGTRKYDWEKRQMFALNPTEVGCLISLGLGESCEFFHDPSMKSSLEGQVKKSLSVKPVSSDDGGYFFSLTVNNNILKRSDRLSLPVSKAEFGVMRTSLSFILPYIMGWDRIVKRQSTAAPEQVGWDRIVKRQSTTTPELVAPQSDFMPCSPHAEWSR